jgi:hypothetical protein
MQLAGNEKGKEACFGRAKNCLIDLLLECSIGELYNFMSIWIIRGVFSGRIRPEDAPSDAEHTTSCIIADDRMKP